MTAETFSLFDLAPGRTVGERFRIVAPRRQSGLSTVFEALDEPAQRRCELMVFPGALFESAEQALEFRHSWIPWTELSSPHVLDVREVLELPHGTTAVVTDFPPGAPLRERLVRHGPMDVEPGIALGLQLLDGLAEIHRRSLVHGDVKPQTIYLDGTEGREKGGGATRGVLVDGGVTLGLWSAKHLGDRTALIGTPFYAPVEQFGGEAPDVQSDVYNLATVLFELLTGVLPWPGRSLLEVFQAKLDRSAPSMRRRAPDVEVPEEIERAIVRGLMADRAERHPDAEAFRRELEAAAGA